MNLNVIIDGFCMDPLNKQGKSFHQSKDAIASTG